MIPTDKIQDFFFMDNDEEEKEYGASTKVPNFSMHGDIVKQKSKDKVCTYTPLNIVSIGKQVQTNTRF